MAGVRSLLAFWLGGASAFDAVVTTIEYPLSGRVEDHLAYASVLYDAAYGSAALVDQLYVRGDITENS